MKHVKKILSITSALLCAVGLLGTQFPEVNAAENVYGEFTYVLYDSNNDGKNDSVEITDCDEFVTRADIPDEIEGMPVTKIKDFVFAVCFSAKNVKAMEIAEDGEYTLVLSTTWDEDEYIDGKIFKIIRFNLAEDETTVNVSDLTKGVEVFNGKNIFKNCWKRSSSEEIVTELKISDFNGSGELWNGSKAEQYTNGCVLYPKFSDEPLKKEGKYYIILDGFAGKVNGENEVKIVKAADEFNSLDLSEYTAERSGCDFCGWGYDGQQITKVDKSFFKDDDVTVTITALYKSKKFYGVDSKGLLNNPDLPEEERSRSYVLNLDANGGMLENKEIKQYDYLGGGNSGTSMAIFHYIPVKYGYIFKGWNNKKDGRGNYYKYMYWRSWRGREDSEFDLAGKIADSD